MAKGYAQKHDIDFNDMFALMVKFTSIKMLLIVAAIKNLEIYQVDFKNAFLNGNLNETIFMEQFNGHVLKAKEEFVCKIQQFLYGLK